MKAAQRERNDALRAELDAFRTNPESARDVPLGAYVNLVTTPLGSIANSKRWATSKGVAYAEVRTAHRAMGKRGGVAVIVRAVDVEGMEVTYEDIAPRGECIAAGADPATTYFFQAVKR